MKNVRLLLTALVVFPALVACGSATPATPVPAAPTNASVMPTATAAQPSATATQPAVTAMQPAVTAMRPAASATPPSAMATQPSAAKSDLPGIATAFAKTKTATVYKVLEDFSGSAIFTSLPSDPSDPEFALIHVEGEINGVDRHLAFKGFFATLLGADMSKGFELTQSDGKTYVHGPALAFDALQDRWYALDSSRQGTFNFSPLDLLDKIAGAGGDWSRFDKVRSGDALDGQLCDVYSAGPEATTDIFAALLGGSVQPVVDEGTVELYVCGDGYLHNIAASLSAHDGADSSKKGTASLKFRVYDLNSSISIKPPADAIALATRVPVPTKAPLPTATPGFASQVLKFGGEGTGAGLFTDAKSIALDAAGNIYVGDFKGGRVQVFGPDGKYITQWKVGNSTTYISSLAADRKGAIYVVADGEIVRVEGTTGKVLGSLQYPEGDRFDSIAMTADGGLLAMWYEEQFGIITSIQGHRDDLVRFGPDGKVTQMIRGFLSNQTGDFELNTRIAVDGLGTIYALPLDDADPSVFKFTPEGKYVNKFGSHGDGLDQFNSPSAIAVDNQSRVYVADRYKILVFDGNGRYLDAIKLDEYTSITAMVFNDKNELFAVGNTQVLKFAVNRH